MWRRFWRETGRARKGVFELIGGELVFSRPEYSNTIEGVKTKGRNSS